MILLIHGIFTTEAKKSIGKIKQFKKDAEIFDYGYIGVLGALFKNNSIAKGLAEKIKTSKTPVTIYAHSNGNAVSVIAAAKHGAEIENLICLAPALNRNQVFPPSIKNILVISTKNDKATKAARLFDGLPFIGWLVPDIWGSMGTDGYTGTDNRVKTIKLGKLLDGHGDCLSDKDLPNIILLSDTWLLSLK